MATDPRWSDDEKKRRGLFRRDLDHLQERGAVGYVADAARQTVSDAREGFRIMGEAGEAVLFGREGQRERQRQRSLAREQAAAPAPDFSNVRAETGATLPTRNGRLDLGDTRRTGLTRIFKSKDANGNSVYTNIPGAAPAGAEERFYNQYGNRQTDFSNEGLDVARASLGYAQRGEQARASLDAQAELDALPPEDRRAIMVEQMQQGGLDRRARLDRGLRRELGELTANTTLAGTQRQAANDAFNQDKYERERLSDPATAALAIRETLGGLGNLSREDKIRALSNPEDPRYARTIDAVRALVGGVTENPNVNLGQVSETGGLRRFTQAITPFTENYRFTDNAGAIMGEGFNPEEFGLNDDDLQLLIDAYLQTQSRERR